VTQEVDWTHMACLPHGAVLPLLGAGSDHRAQYNKACAGCQGRVCAGPVGAEGLYLE